MTIARSRDGNGHEDTTLLNKHTNFKSKFLLTHD